MNERDKQFTTFQIERLTLTKSPGSKSARCLCRSNLYSSGSSSFLSVSLSSESLSDSKSEMSELLSDNQK